MINDVLMGCIWKEDEDDDSNAGFFPLLFLKEEKSVQSISLQKTRKNKDRNLIIEIQTWMQLRRSHPQ